MYTNRYKNLGLGSATLKFFKDATFNSELWASPNDGVIREDGSHLTVDAPGFVRKMIAEGLSNGYNNDSHATR